MRRHHPTGAVNGVYLDSGLVFAITSDEHDEEHDVRRSLGLDQGARAISAVERVELRLRRLAVFFVKTFAPRLPEGPARCFIVLLARCFVTWADELAEANTNDDER